MKSVAAFVLSGSVAPGGGSLCLGSSLTAKLGLDARTLIQHLCTVCGTAFWTVLAPLLLVMAENMGTHDDKVVKLFGCLDFRMFQNTMKGAGKILLHGLLPCRGEGA